MARYKGKYQLPRSRKRRGGGSFLWLVVFALIVFGVWLWWNDHKQPEPQRPLAELKPVQSNALAPAAVNRASSPVEPAPPPPAQKPTQPTQIPVFSDTFPRQARDTLETQIVLARNVMSPGSIDGVMGSQTRAALLAFQRKQRLPQTGVLDPNTRAAMLLTSPPLTACVVTSDDLARLQPLSKTWLGKSQQTALDYETILELVAERGHASPTLTRRLNPGVDWTNVVAGTELKIPDANYPAPTEKAAFAVISLGEKTLEAFDAVTNLLAHFPCSIAARVEKRPVGELHVVVIAPHPNYTFNPDIFPESEEGRQLGRKLVLPPGPNNPVGVAWVGLDQPGYGIHGTPVPEHVGRTESHGCFRLANWNAEYFLKLVWMGMPVYVEP